LTTPDGKRERTFGGVARAVALGSLPPLLILLLWVSSTDSTQVPTMGEVWDVLSRPFDEPRIDSRSLAYSTLVSFLRVLLGFTLAAVTAIPLGILVARVGAVRETFSPIIEMARPICPVAWLPLFIVIFGDLSLGSLAYGDEAWRHDPFDQLAVAMVVVIWWGAFFPIFVNTVHGVKNVKTLFLEVARVCGASRWVTLGRVVLPAALPAIVAGLRIGVGTAWLVIVAAEFYPGTRAGLSYMMTEAESVGKPQYIFASIIVIGAIGFTINALLRGLEDRVSCWQAKER
jgi:NitT/TauT family transport system permease protein